MEDAHAVQVVGYDNTRQAWLIKNSWGPGFAVKGFAWVSFDAPSMCDPQDTYGFVFQPYLPPPAAAHASLSPAPGRKGCYTYRAVAGDYPEGLASRYGLRVQQLLLDNLGVIKDPSAVPAGTGLMLCGVSPAALAGGAVVTGAGPTGAPAPGALPATTTTTTTTSSSSSSREEEMRVLMAIKRVLAPVADGLADWQLGSPSPCSWTGVTCDRGTGRVKALGLWDSAANKTLAQLSGRLPSGTLLRGLPALTVIALSGTGVGGPLPEDWSQLGQLDRVLMSRNKLTGESAHGEREYD
jgi:hypothetical protein